MGNILINDEKFVKNQYKNSNGLSTRISIHDKYSTNKMGLHNWYFTVMKLEDGIRVLELGAGNAAMWINHKEEISRFSLENGREILLEHMVDGVLKLPKDPGTFVAWWDGVANGLGIGILRWVLSFALILLYVIILIDPMSRRTKAEVA